MKTEEIIKELEKRRNQLIKDFEINISAISNTIQMLKNEEENHKLLNEVLINQSIPYDDNSELHKLKSNLISDSILNVLHYKNRFLHNSEITDLLSIMYIGRERVKFSRQISGVLSKLKKASKIISYTESNSQKDIYWGLDTWLINGKIIEGHEYYKK